MRYGRFYDRLTPSQVETPMVGTNLFVNADDGALWAKYTDGSASPITGGTVAPGAGTDALFVDSTTPNAIEVDITGVVAYAAGDVYNIYIGSNNTGAVTLDINGLGVKDVKKWGALDTALVAADLEANTFNRFLYTGTQFEWIGQVIDGKTYNRISMDFNDFSIAALTQTIVISKSPAKISLDYAMLRPTVKFIGGGATTAKIDIAEKNTALAIITASDVFADVDAVKGAQTGPVASISKVYSRTGTSEWQITLTSDVNLSLLTQGSLDLLLITSIVE